MLENPDFWSRTAESIYKTGHNSFRSMKWLIYYDRSYHDKLNYFNL